MPLLRPAPWFFFTKTMMRACAKEAEARAKRVKPGADWSVGDKDSHLQRQLAGVMGEYAVAVLLGLEAKGAVLGKKVGRKGTAGDGGEFDFSVPRLQGATVEVKTKFRPDGLDRLPHNKPGGADVWVLAVRVLQEESPEPDLRAVRIVGWVYGWEWAEKEREVEVGPPDHRAKALRIPLDGLREFEELELAAWPDFGPVGGPVATEEPSHG